MVKVCGGGIVFGGGVPVYKNGHIIGGLGVSGDTPCADHEIAKRVRHIAGLDPKGGPAVDDIQYSRVDHASVYTHPLCPNTWRNGQKIGEEPRPPGIDPRSGSIRGHAARIAGHAHRTHGSYAATGTGCRRCRAHVHVMARASLADGYM